MERSTTEQPTCAELVEQAWQRKREALKEMLDPGPEDLSIERVVLGKPDGTEETIEYIIVVAERTVTNDNGADLAIDTDFLCELAEEGTGSPYIEWAAWSEGQRLYVATAIFENHEGHIRTTAAEAFHEYGLCFDYVAPGTFTDQETGYWRYQISWGGPSEEIRFYGASTDTYPALIEFWYLDWFDGAPLDVTGDTFARMVWEEFDDLGMVDGAYERAELQAE